MPKDDDLTHRLDLINHELKCKFKAAGAGYFNDHILLDLIYGEIDYEGAMYQEEARGGCNCFHHEPKQYSKLTSTKHRAFAARWMSLELMVDRLISLEQVDCFVILGSGLDSLSLRPRSAQCHFIEIDLPEVMRSKGTYISKKFECSSSDTIVYDDGKISTFSFLNVHLISCDLTDHINLSRMMPLVLENIPLDERKRVAVLTEKCLHLFEHDHKIQIFKTLIEIFSPTAEAIYYIGYEPIKSDRPNVLNYVMLNSYDYRKGTGQTLASTRRQLHNMLQEQLGFNFVNIYSMYHIHHNILNQSAKFQKLEEFPQRGGIFILSRVLFDEYEGLDMYLANHALISAVLYLKPTQTSKCPSSFFESEKTYCQPETISSDDENLLTVDTESYKRPIRRYGHSSCLISSSSSMTALVSGGYGLGFNTDKNLYSDIFEELFERKPKRPQYQHLSDCYSITWSEQGTSANRLNMDLPLGITLNRMYGQMCYLGGDMVFFNGGRRTPERSGHASSDSFVAHRNWNSLRFETRVKSDSSLRWRHRTLRFEFDKCIQVGGINGNSSAADESPIGIWNFSSDRCGFASMRLADQQERSLDRHTFGMDLKDDNTLLVFGGLKASGTTDKPVDAINGVILLDLRSPNSLRRFNCLRQSYDSQVHFINENQFVKMGGISTTTGLPENFVDLYDLRNDNQGLPVTRKAIPTTNHSSLHKSVIPIEMTSVHSKQFRKISTIGGGGRLFTHGEHYNEYQVICKY